MSKKYQEVLINGVYSRIFKNKSEGELWTIEKANKDTISIIDTLLENHDSNFKFNDGITIINPKTTTDLVKETECSRPSNHTGIIRSECGANVLLTYYQNKSRLPYYGIIKNDKNIKTLKELKKRIISKLVEENIS